MTTKATTRKKPSKRNKPIGRVWRNDPRQPPDIRECQTQATRIPDNPLDTFLVHPPGSFDPGEDLWVPRLHKSLVKAATDLMSKGYVLAVCATPEEAVAMASALSIHLKINLVWAYDENQEMLWFKAR